jgi:uncharacterized membrane protein YhaH (DUF805 family)
MTPTPQAAETKKNPLQYFAEAVKKYAVFSGRARRAEFWWFVLFYLIIPATANYIGTKLGMESVTIGFLDNHDTGLNLLGNIANLFFLLPGLSVGIRRMHDLGKSGWYVLIPIYDIALWATAGNAGSNQYGADPKGA